MLAMAPRLAGALSRAGSPGAYGRPQPHARARLHRGYAPFAARAPAPPLTSLHTAQIQKASLWFLSACLPFLRFADGLLGGRLSRAGERYAALERHAALARASPAGSEARWIVPDASDGSRACIRVCEGARLVYTRRGGDSFATRPGRSTRRVYSCLRWCALVLGGCRS